jgi:hypothetical protein
LLGAVKACLDLDLGRAFAAAATIGQRIDRATVARRFAEDMREWAGSGTIPAGEQTSPRTAQAPEAVTA